MVCIDGSHAVCHFSNGYNTIPVGGFCFELHTGFYGVGTIETIQGHIDNELLIPESIRLRCRHGNGKRIPYGFVFQDFFKSGNEVVITVEIREGAAIGGCIQNLSIRSVRV